MANNLRSGVLRAVYMPEEARAILRAEAAEEYEAERGEQCLILGLLSSIFWDGGGTGAGAPAAARGEEEEDRERHVARTSRLTMSDQA